MGRTAKHNWAKLFLEYNQGRYKSARQFAEAKGLNYDRLKKEFKKLRDGGQNRSEKQSPNKGKKGRKTGAKITPPKHTAWDALRKQFTDWPKEKLQAYLVQIEQRLAELNAVDYEELTKEEQKELGQLRRERRAILSDPDPGKQCTAHRHDGQPCKNPAERGKNVCWVHGGAPGIGAPRGTRNGMFKHGFFCKIFPDDPETKEIIEEIDAKSPIDILWDQIVIQYAQIARAQKLMYVRDQDDIKKHLKRVKHGDTFSEKEWEFQYPWDRHAAFLTAQSKAMATLERLIARYEAMATEEQKLKVAKLKADIARITGGDDGGTEDDGFIDALRAEAAEVWSDET